MSILDQGPSDVVIQEINLSSVVTSASSSVACQIITSSQGSPSPKFFTNAQDYLSEYGNPNASISFDVYCALDYFKEGNQLWGMRILGAGAIYSAISMYSNGTVSSIAGMASGITDPLNISWDTIDPVNTTPVAVFYPINGQGSYGNNIAISISSLNVVVPTVALGAVVYPTGGILAAGTYQYQISAISATGETLPSQAFVSSVTGSSTTNSIALGFKPIPLALGYRIYGRTSNAANFGLLAQLGQSAAETTGQFAGSIEYIDTGEITPDITQIPVTVAPTSSPYFAVNVFDTLQSSTVPVETFSCTLVSVTDGNGLSTGLEELINPFSQYIQVVSNVSSLLTIPTINSSPAVKMLGGASGAAPTNNQIAAAWSTFANKNLYSINILINSGKSDPIVQLAMDQLAQSRGDCVALLDVPSSLQASQDAVNYRNLDLNLNSTYSALFNPDVLENDSINGKQQYVPFSGWAAGLCARTDRVANPSFSIAGLNRGIVDVLKSRYSFDEGQNAAMYAAQVNYTRTFLGQGTALWEQQTLAKQQSALSFLSVRRIVNVMKTALFSFAQFQLQEPNDEFSGRQIVAAFTDYLTLIKNARGISSFDVVSDASNNTAAMFNSGLRNVSVIIVPVLPIHRISLQMVISKQGVNFSETLTAING